jgi:hypothetical protein
MTAARQEEAPARWPRPSSSPLTRWHVCRGCRDATGLHERPSHYRDNVQRMGPIHHENVAQNPVAARPLITVHYQIEVRCCRDTAAPKFLARRRLPFFGCQLDTDNKYALDPPIQRTDVPTPNPRRVPEGASTRTGASSRLAAVRPSSKSPPLRASPFPAALPFADYFRDNKSAITTTTPEMANPAK